MTGKPAFTFDRFNLQGGVLKDLNVKWRNRPFAVTSATTNSMKTG